MNAELRRADARSLLIDFLFLAAAAIAALALVLSLSRAGTAEAAQVGTPVPVVFEAVPSLPSLSWGSPASRAHVRTVLGLARSEVRS